MRFGQTTKIETMRSTHFLYRNEQQNKLRTSYGAVFVCVCVFVHRSSRHLIPVFSFIVFLLFVEWKKHCCWNCRCSPDTRHDTCVVLHNSICMETRESGRVVGVHGIDLLRHIAYILHNSFQICTLKILHGSRDCIPRTYEKIAENIKVLIVHLCALIRDSKSVSKCFWNILKLEWNLFQTPLKLPQYRCEENTNHDCRQQTYNKAISR